MPGATGEHEKSRDAGRPVRPPVTPTARGWPLRWTVLAVVGGLVVCLAVVFAPVALTSSLSYCRSCHAMKPAIDSWERSVHGAVSCTTCHIEPGVGNALRWRLQETKNIWADYLGVKTGMAATVHRPSNKPCEECHTVAELPDEVNGVRMPHEVHTSLRNLVCADCHNNVSHAERGQPSAATMNMCTMCHNDRGAPDQCDFCHVQPPPKKVHPTDYTKTHGAEAIGREADCLRCHHDKKAFCDACHAKPPASHFAGDWRYAHGTDARGSRQVCFGCHSYENFCLQCHEVSHPANWGRDHATVAAAGEASCLVCHPQAMCDGCHAQKGVTP